MFRCSSAVLGIVMLVMTAAGAANAEPIPEEYTQNFYAACMENATKRRNFLISDSYCRCAVGEVRARFDRDGFEAWEKAMSAGEQSARATTQEIISHCARQVSP